ncbi:MAG: hypothetical protein AB7O59_24800 [Pirellulales bacterium]
MATARTNRNTVRREAEKEIENAREITRDVVDYLTDYARENPGYAALACLGVGFVLGWKLKPW